MSDTHSDDLSHQWYIADDIPLEIDTSFDTSVNNVSFPSGRQKE